jgi:hypothetical protein
VRDGDERQGYVVHLNRQERHTTRTVTVVDEHRTVVYGPTRVIPGGADHNIRVSIAVDVTG